MVHLGSDVYPRTPAEQELEKSRALQVMLYVNQN